MVDCFPPQHCTYFDQLLILLENVHSLRKINTTSRIQELYFGKHDIAWYVNMILQLEILQVSSFSESEYFYFVPSSVFNSYFHGTIRFFKIK